MPVKILLKGPDESPEVVKIEISSEKNFFLLYEHTSDVFDYDQMREQQGLYPVFADYLTMLIKLFNQAITNPSVFRCAIQLNIDYSASLFFNQVLPYKELKLLGCTFTRASEERIHLHNKFKHKIATIRL